MSNINNILNKIAKAEKTELAKHEVNLSLKDDIEKSLNNLYNDFNIVDKGIVKFYNDLSNAKKTYEAINSEIPKVLNYEKILQAKKDELLKVGKELGIDVTNAPFYKDLLAAQNRFKDIKEEFKAADGIYKSIKL